MDKYVEIVREGYNQLASTYNKWAETVRMEERNKYLAKIDTRRLPRISTQMRPNRSRDC